MIEIAIITLALLCIGQMIERVFYQRDMTNKLNDAIKAVLSRNINEYLTAISDKPKNTPPIEQDQIDFEGADDETFDKAIKKM